jgi:hypothetical protein
MNKYDLRTGMIVKSREGNFSMILLGVPNQGNIIVGRNESWNFFGDNYNDDLTHNEFEELDIDEVYAFAFNYFWGTNPIPSNLLWSREAEVKKKEFITREEVEKLIEEKLGGTRKAIYG